MLEVLGCWLAHGHDLDAVLDLTPDQMHIGALAITTYKTSVVTAYMAPLGQAMEALVPGLKVKPPSVRERLLSSRERVGERRVALSEESNASGGKTRKVDLTAAQTPEQRDVLARHMQMLGLPFVVQRVSAPPPAASDEPSPTTTE